MADNPQPLLLAVQPFQAQADAERDSGFPFRLSLPTVAPGQIAGALRIVSLALHILPHKGERRRRNVLARKVSGLNFYSETRFSTAQLPASTHTAAENPQHTASLDELAEPNYYSNWRETSSTRVFASQLPAAFQGSILRFATCACLIPAPASKLQVFQIIEHFVLLPLRRITARFDEECMGRFRSGGRFCAVAVLSFCWAFSACGGGSKAGAPLFAGKINLAPSTNISMVLGGTLNFTSSVQTVSGINLNTPVTFSSSNTSILNIASNGVACAGHWDATFSTCSPGATGVVLVTASALGSTSIPTYVFVHPSIDTITVTGILLNGIPIQEPCLSQSQTMTLEAHAFSQGTDVTASVGPFTWSESNPSVATLTPLVNSAYNFPTNQVTATASVPGITRIFASASGVTSSSFQQPSTPNSPVLDFFSTCPVQNIALEVGQVGSGQTSFAISKGSSTASQTVYATVTDVMGNSSLPNTTGGIVKVVLSKTPLTWVSSQPGAISVGSNCTESCQLTLNSPGAASITASCSPPACNVGFPELPASLSTNGVLDPVKVNSCTTFFQAQYPQFGGCQELIPVPVYSSNVFVNPPNAPIQLSPTGAIAGLVSGTPSAASILAASTGCANEPPANCSSAVYYLSTAKASPGNENPTPTAPNSLLFDLTGDKVIMGSDFSAQVITPASFGGSTNAFLSLGAVTGKALATTINGSISVLSDTLHTPNQVYVVNTANASGISDTPLNISGATTAAFSPDTLKGYIVGGTGATSLYVYSPLQALQGPFALSLPGDAIGFSPNGAFAYIAESAPDGSSANITAYATCNNQPAGTLALPAFSLPAPVLPNLMMKVLPNVHIDGSDSQGNPIPDGIHILVLDSTGFDIITSTISEPVGGTLCPQLLSFSVPQRIELGQGTLSPVNFFASPDGTQLYIVNAANSSILVYSFISGSVTGGIELAGGATPLSADMSIDGSTIAIAGSDGMLHEVSTQLSGSDLVQLSFPNLPNYFNAFCSITPASGTPCILNTVLVKP